MAAYATLTDYEQRHGTVSTVEMGDKVRAESEDASALIRSVLPAGYTPAAELTRALAVKVAGRSITNPGGRRSKTVGSVSESYGEDGGLYLSDRELAMLLAGYNAGQPSAYTVDLRDDGLRLPQRRCWPTSAC
jgi:hypothetical protein